MSEANSPSMPQMEAQKIVESIKKGEDIQLRDVQINGAFNLRGVTVTGLISIEHSRFRDAVDLSQATFKNVVSLTSTTFMADVTFKSISLEKDIFLSEAIFQGAADLSNLDIQGVFYNDSSVFERDVTFHESYFHKSAVFEHCQFKGDANFGGATAIEGEANFIGAAFDGRANFYSLQARGKGLFRFAKFNGVANFPAAHFESDINFAGASFAEIANFNDAKLEGNAYFWSTAFEKLLNFNGMQITGNAEFPGTVFRDEVNFNGAQMRNLFCSPADDEDMETFLLTHFPKPDALTQDEHDRIQRAKAAVEFGGEVDFVSTSISGYAQFNGAIFKAAADFNSVHIGHSADFRRVTFQGETDFSSTLIDAAANFSDTSFKGGVSFNSAHIGNNVSFTNASFSGNVNFGYTQMDGVVEFTDAEFQQDASFNSSHINGNGFFGPATFKGKTDFGAAQFKSVAVFSAAVFEQEALFFNTQFADMRIDATSFKGNLNLSGMSCAGTLYLDATTTFLDGIDLRNCSYYDIDPVDQWNNLLTPLTPFDRQPYTQLEQTVRRSGDDQLANRVYFAGRQRRSKQIRLSETPLAWLVDRFLWQVAGYGVQIWRLFAICGLILLIGAVVFFASGAVVTKATPPEVPQVVNMSFLNALMFSVKQFLPIEIPFGGGWDPSEWAIGAATALKIVGWILVPVGVAAITGVLKH